MYIICYQCPKNFKYSMLPISEELYVQHLLPMSEELYVHYLLPMSEELYVQYLLPMSEFTKIFNVSTNCIRIPQY
jgi:hypothetical protein